MSHNSFIIIIFEILKTPTSYYCFIFQNLSINTFTPVISEVCLPNSIILSDEWRGWSSLSSLGFTHEIFKKDLNSINSFSNNNAQKIELIKNKLETRIKKIWDLALNLLKNIYLNGCGKIILVEVI